jgi:tetratricopeptide (TPR) repeat protein
MSNGYRFLFLAPLALALTACATVGSQYQSSTMSNINAAPASMSPPNEGVNDIVVDPTYVRSKADYHFALGEALSLEGNSERAVEEFKLTAVYDPQAATVRLRLAGEYMKLGLMTEAIEQAEAGLQLEPQNTDLHLFLGGVYSTIKMYAEALKEYEKIMAIEPKNLEVPLYMGAVLAEQSQYDAAEKSFLKSATAPDYEKAHLGYYYIGRMRTLQGASGYKRAEQAFQKALSIKPEFEDAVTAFAELYEIQNQKEKSIALLESFQTQYGPKKMIAFQLGQTYLEQEKYDKAYRHLVVLESFEPQNLNVKMKLALILIEQKNYDNAIEKLEEILSLSPTSDKVRFYLGAVHEETSNFADAIYHFKKIESSSSHYVEATVHVAYMYQKMNRTQDAIEVVEKAITEREDVPQFYAFYASLLDEKKEYDRGISVMEKAAKRFPKSAQVRYYLGSLYDRVNNKDKSIQAMKAVLEIDKDHVQALNFLAYTYAELGRELEAAEKMAIRALELQPNDPYIMDTVGWVHFKAGRTEEAIRYLEAAHRLKPDESIVAEHLGDAYYVFELADKAREMYIKAVAVEKNESKKIELRNKIVQIENPSQRSPASMPAATQGR